MKNIKLEKGITLIALVITIIVLLILAGVAIAMLSGENGILKRASDAKSDTEKMQKSEEKSLERMNLETYFLTNKLKYKCAYGYVTGIEIGEQVSELEAVLQAGGYELKIIDGKENVTTGMEIQKNKETIAYTVIFGDVNGNGQFESTDWSLIMQLSAGATIEGIDTVHKIAADVNHDGIINQDDANLFMNDLGGKAEINQNAYAVNPDKLVIQ